MGLSINANGLGSKFKPKPKAIMGKAQTANVFTNLGLSTKSNPLKPKSTLISLWAVQSRVILHFRWWRRRKRRLEVLRVRAAPFAKSDSAPPLPAPPRVSASRLSVISSFEFAENDDGTLTTWRLAQQRHGWASWRHHFHGESASVCDDRVKVWTSKGEESREMEREREREGGG